LAKLSLSRNWKLYFGLVGFLWLLVAIKNLIDYHSPDWFGFSLAIMLSLFHLVRFWDNLEINEKGFTYQSFGIKYSGMWLDVKNYTKQKELILGWLGVNGVYIPKIKLSSGGNHVLSKNFFLPWSHFDTQWERSEIGHKIKQQCSCK